MTILLTGFEPFGRWTVNSSGEAARRLGEAPGRRVRILPVDHHAAPVALAEALDEARPDVLLLTGLASEMRPRLEVRARRPARVPSGHAVLAGVWPWASALGFLRSAQCAGRLSTDAGAYVCETTYWSALAHRAESGAPRLVAFLHLPPLSEAWPLERIVTAVSAVLDAALDKRPPAA